MMPISTLIFEAVASFTGSTRKLPAGRLPAHGDGGASGLHRKGVPVRHVRREPVQGVRPFGPQHGKELANQDVLLHAVAAPLSNVAERALE